MWMNDRLDHHMQSATMKSVCWTFSMSIRWRFEATDWEYRRFLLPHITSCIQDKTDAIFKILEAYIELLQQARRMLQALSEGGQYVMVVGLEEGIQELIRQKLGEDHPHALTSMCKLAGYYDRLGQSDRAAELGERVLGKTKQKLGEDHPHALI
jgi:hypothetical protein